MSKKQIKEKAKFLSTNKAVKIYKKVLNGTKKDFPKHYWSESDNAQEDAIMCVRYMVEVVLKWDEKDYKKLSNVQLKTYHLDKMLEDVFEGNIYNLVDTIYPGKYYEWTFLGRKKGYWSKEKLIWAVKYIFDSNGWDDKEIQKRYSYRFLSNNGLEYAVKKFYNNKIYDLLEDVYSNKSLRLWEMNSVPRGFWTSETAISATMWMVNKLGWSRSKIKKDMTKDVFNDMGLGGMLKLMYNNSVYDAINAAYPGEYKRYEFKLSKGYWTEETTINAILEMIKELEYTKEDICLKLSREDFKKYKLDYPVQKFFEGSYYNAINAVYPGEYGRYDLKNFRYKEVKMNEIAEYIKYYEY